MNHGSPLTYPLFPCPPARVRHNHFHPASCHCLHPPAVTMRHHYLLVSLAVLLASTAASAVEPSDLRPGLIATFRDSSSTEITRLEPTVALWLAGGEAPHPRLGGLTSARWKGYVNITRPGKHVFSANIQGGTIRVSVGGKLVLSGMGAPNEVEIEGGVQTFEATFTSTSTPARVELPVARSRFCQRAAQQSFPWPPPCRSSESVPHGSRTGTWPISLRGTGVREVSQGIGKRSDGAVAGRAHRPKPDRYRQARLSRLDRCLARRPGQAPAAHDDAETVRRQRSRPGGALCDHEIPRFAFRSVGRAVSPTIQRVQRTAAKRRAAAYFTASPAALHVTSRLRPRRRARRRIESHQSPRTSFIHSARRVHRRNTLWRAGAARRVPNCWRPIFRIPSRPIWPGECRTWS